jgi:hypothetical protein
MAKDGKKARPGSATELSELYPGPHVVPVQVRKSPNSNEFEDAEVQVFEMDIRQIAQAAKALQPIAHAIAPNSSFIVLAAEHPDEIFAALGVAIRWPAGRVEMLGGASFGRVAVAVWEVNQDFFGQLLGLLVSGSMAMPAAASGAGPTPLATFDAGATATPPH